MLAALGKSQRNSLPERMAIFSLLPPSSSTSSIFVFSATSMASRLLWLFQSRSSSSPSPFSFFLFEAQGLYMGLHEGRYLSCWIRVGVDVIVRAGIKVIDLIIWSIEINFDRVNERLLAHMLNYSSFHVSEKFPYGISKLRYVMTGIALSGYEEISSFVLGEPFKPVYKKEERM
ncbi:hypothetical protein F0562_027294 [Nyssa sinensis]|uniref:Uncharacterized protein n=1 Tax=Nyssa sinensis TaxID=561372 RepID=A0A5J5B610_9ASTE|nr:hypothetical protein F0562_027294 [Nyssa sinensis]